MLAIKNNLMAENAARNLGKSYEALAKSVQRLSSGLRINSAKDDSAGMAVSELIRADVAVLKQGSRNANDAVSMLQTAEGAMGVVDDLLVRMKELAEQAATDSYSDTQRTIMNSEFQQLALEMTRIASSTGFNNIYLLDSTSTFNFHVGSSTTIDFVAETMTATGLGLGNTGSAEYTTNKVGTPNPNLTGWITGGDGASNDGNFDIQFGTETAIGAVTFTDGTTYSMNQVAQMINAASQTAGSYNAASISYDSGTNLYSLKISAKNNGDVAVVYNAGSNDQVGLLSTDFTGTNGATGGAVAIDTKSGAISALTSLSTAIDTKDSYRAKMGYMMNRLESASSIVNIQAENLLAAQSRISDVDTATESAAMTRNQVLAQAGIAILAQANTMPQMALQLMK
jgi:flagellin